MLLNIRKFLGNNIIIICSVLLLFIFFWFISRFTPSNTAFLSGEYVFSFDYPSHLRNIISEYISNPISLIQNTQCYGCPGFFNQSRWQSLFKFFVLQSGVWIGFNEFWYYVFLIISTELLALYILVKLNFQRIRYLPFFLASTVYILLPYHFTLLQTDFHGVINAVLISFLAIYIYTLNNLKKLTFKKILLTSMLAGFILSFALNIAVTYFPLLFYSTIIISIFFFKNLKTNLSKFIISLTTLSLVAMIINLPMVLSVLLLHLTRSYFGYDSYTLYSALNFGMNIAQVSNIWILVFLAILFVLTLISGINKKIKILLIVSYFFVGYLCIGVNAWVNIYDYIFYHFPLMSSIRATSRFFFFEGLIAFVFIYSGCKFLWEQKKMYKFFGMLLLSLLIFIDLKYIYSYRYLIHTVSVPKSYKAVASYFNNSTEQAVYFPYYLPIGQTMAGAYSWYDFSPLHPIAYSNPFLTFYNIPNLVHSEPYFSYFGTYSVQSANPQLRSQLNYTNPPEDIIKSLEYSGVKFLIVDRYFLWSKIFPQFNVTKLQSELTLEKQYGNLYVYQLKDLSKFCKSSYGNYVIGYCLKYNSAPSYLVNMDKEEYYLDKEELQNNSRFNVYERLHNFIFDPDVQKSVIKDNIFIPFQIYQVENVTQNVFSTQIKKGEYHLYVPVLRVSLGDGKNEAIQILLNNKKIGEINNSQGKGVFWYKVGFSTNQANSLTFNAKGNNDIIVGMPVLYDHVQWNSFKKFLTNSYRPKLIPN